MRVSLIALLACAAIPGCTAPPETPTYTSGSVQRPRSPQEIEAAVLTSFRTLSGQRLEEALEASVNELKQLLPDLGAERLLKDLWYVFPHPPYEDELTVFIPVTYHQGAIEIMGHIQEAEDQLKAGNTSKAIVEYENAEFKIQVIPFELPLLTDRLPEVQQQILKLKNEQLR